MRSIDMRQLGGLIEDGLSILERGILDIKTHYIESQNF